VAPEPIVPGLVAFADDGACVLLGHRCGACGTLGFPRAGVCGSCAATDPEPIELGRRGGKLFGWTTVATAPPGYEGPLPYGFGIVELEDGLRVVGRLAGDPDAWVFGQAMGCVPDPLGVWAFTAEQGVLEKGAGDTEAQP
jgi:uncharacterized protein